MKLMTEEMRKKLPPIYTNENAETPMVVCKWFDPCGSWTWFVMEFDGEDLCFGLVVGWETELGYFSLSELACLRNAFGLPLERDLSFEPTPLSEVRASLDKSV